MKEKHRILSKKNKKVKQLMRRFQDESEDDDEKKYNKEAIKPKKQVQKQQDFQILDLKRKNSDRTNDSFDVVNQSEEEQVQVEGGEEVVRKKTSMSSVFSKILTQEVNTLNTTDNPIFSEFNKPLKKVKQEIRKDRENTIKKRIKILKESRGHVLPQNSPDGQLYEKELKIQAAKGIIKILDAVKQYQQDEGIEAE